MDDDNNFEELTSEAYPASGTVEAAPNVAPAFSSSATFDVAENQTAVGTVQAYRRRRRRQRDGLHHRGRR